MCPAKDQSIAARRRARVDELGTRVVGVGPDAAQCDLRERETADKRRTVNKGNIVNVDWRPQIWSYRRSMSRRVFGTFRRRTKPVKFFCWIEWVMARKRTEKGTPRHW